MANKNYRQSLNSNEPTWSILSDCPWARCYKRKDKTSEYNKDYYQKHKKRITEIRKQYKEKYPQKIKEWEGKHHQKYSIIPRYRIDNSISSMIRQSLKGEKADRKWESLVGYTIRDLMKHLESLFDDKMTWENYGAYWDIDHIKPKSLFHYETVEDSEFKKCWVLKNLQPMEHIVNLKKSNHYGTTNII
jgi:hypothetical protein